MDIKASEIPVVKKADVLGYNFDTNEVKLKDQTKAEVTYDAFKRFGTIVQIDYDPKSPPYLEILKKLLPPNLQDFCEIIHPDQKDQNKILPSTLVVEPSHLSEIAFLWRTGLDQQGLSGKTRQILENIITQLESSLKKSRISTENDRGVVDRAYGEMTKIWHILKQHAELPDGQIIQEKARNIRLHELTHYITNQSLWDGVVGQIFKNGVEAVNAVKPAEAESGSESRIKKLFNLLKTMNESESILREILGQSVLVDKSNYQHHLLCERMLDLLTQFKKKGQENALLIDLILESREFKSKDGSIFREHSTAELLLLYLEEINPDLLVANGDFRELYDQQPDLKGNILDRISYLIEHPDEAAEVLIRAYEPNRRLLKKVAQAFCQEFMGMFIQNPRLLNDLEPQQIQGIRAFREFLHLHPQAFDGEPLQIRPVEVTADVPVYNPTVDQEKDTSKKPSLFSKIRKVFKPGSQT